MEAQPAPEISMRNLVTPAFDPTPLFDLVRGNYQTELLAAALELGLFDALANGPVPESALRQQLGLAPRPWAVLATAIRAMNLMQGLPGQVQQVTDLGRFLQPGGEYDIRGYVGLTQALPGVRAMIQLLKSDTPASNRPNEGAAFIFREGMDSAMESGDSARRLTMALAGRAFICAPILAEVLPLNGVQHLLDLGGGTGIYGMALAQQNPALRVSVLDRPEVLKIAAELLTTHGPADRVDLVTGDLFGDYPSCDAVLLSNVLHDWNEETCMDILTRCHRALKPGGRLFIHDVYLNDAMDGPLNVALYSAALFSLTEGRAYSSAEYRAMLGATGFVPTRTIAPTRVHCGALAAMKAG